VGPTRRLPRHRARVRDLARGRRARAAKKREDIPPEAVVVAQPGAAALVRGSLGGAGEVQPEIARRTYERVELEQRAVLLESALQVIGPVARAEAAPRDEIRAGRDRRGRVELQQRQPPDDLEEVRRARRLEQLRAYRDAPRLLLRQVVQR
jgi:hypothetical protein